MLSFARLSSVSARSPRTDPASWRAKRSGPGARLAGGAPDPAAVGLDDGAGDRQRVVQRSRVTGCGACPLVPVEFFDQRLDPLLDLIAGRTDRLDRLALRVR